MRQLAEWRRFIGGSMAENYKYLMGETEMDGQREFPFEFSVVMAVYNVEPFLREAWTV